jgi:hypothetical protein
MKTPAQRKFEKNLKKIERLEVERFKVKEKYDEWLEGRLELLRSGAFEGKPEGGGGLPEEEKLFKKSEKIRAKLVELCPEKYHYGRVLKSLSSKYSGKKYSRHGDEGYILCLGCCGLFKHRGEHKDLKTIDVFNVCKEHGERKFDALLTKREGEGLWS